MKLSYFPDTDTLYISLSEESSVESDEISDNVVLDYDAEGHVVGIELEHASQNFDLTKLDVTSLPIAG